MNYSKHSLFVMMFLILPVLIKGQETLIFSLEDCLSYALQNNEDIKNAKLEKKAADADIGVVMSEGLPQIDGNLELSHNYIIPVFVIPDSMAESGVRTFQFASPYQGQATVSVTQLLFDGSYFLGLKAAKTFKELSAKDHIKTTTDVVEAVSKAYYSALVNQERMHIVQANYERLDSLLTETRLMYENGFAEKIDVNRIKIQHNNIAVEVERAKDLLALSYYLLKFQMGMPVAQSLRLADDLRSIDFEYLNQQEDNFSYDQRIEYQQLSVSKEISQLSLKNERIQYFPKLEAFGSIGSSMGSQSFDNMFNFSGPNKTWFGNGAIGVRMSVPIFDGLLKSNSIQKDKFQLQQREWQLQQLVNNIDMEIKEARIELNNALRNLEIQKENRQLALEIFETSKVKYQEGVGSNLEVIDADNFYKEAQNAYYNALFDALIAKVDLERALGILL